MRLKKEKLQKDLIVMRSFLRAWLLAFLIFDQGSCFTEILGNVFGSIGVGRSSRQAIVSKVSMNSNWQERLARGHNTHRALPELRYSSASTPSTAIPSITKDRRAPLYLEDGVWLPEDTFAEASTVVRVPNFLSYEEIESIHAAAQAIKKRVGVHVRTLPVDLNVLSAIRGPIVRPPWMTTYLQSMGLNRRLMFDLMEKIEAKVIEIDSQNWRVLPDRYQQTNFYRKCI
jgi:hypothetical protein